MTLVASLAPEWKRIDLLTACVGSARRGQPIGQELKGQLRAVQDSVVGARLAEPWRRLSERARLTTLDQDILACVTAPDAEPRLGWLYQELQPGLMSPYPTQALLRELLFVDERDAPSFHARLIEDAPLRRHRLVEPIHEMYQPLRPTAHARGELLGWTAPVSTPVGAIELPVRAGFSDIVLSAECRTGLEELVAWVRECGRVEREWGARRTSGPVVLFSGPSGTGKTFAAEVFASAIGYRLLRADLGLLISKYIGETEKNLSQLLEAAAEEPVVLLFDEADSLFGRRGDVKDARDRYANMEVSHLLTRIELHRGPCILTTNLRHHVDSAFLRRFQAVIEFSRPDASARARLWSLHLPPRAPRAPDLDPELLGAAVALSGGQIRNAALRAAVLASAAGTCIGLEHVARAVWTELAKEGRELDTSMLGALAPALPKRGAA
jgi:hypothetical protein